MPDKRYGNQVRFITLVGSQQGEWRARLMIQSLRAFGGGMSQLPVWIFLRNGYKPNLPEFSNQSSEIGEIRFIPLVTEEPFNQYPLVDKVFACAQAEELLKLEDCSLTWLNPGSLILKPPNQFNLDQESDAAFRPVHIRNVGSLISDSVDGYWRIIYEVVGVSEVQFSVISFVDEKKIRPYFNTHAFSINPNLGFCRRWLGFFKELVSDTSFQEGFCRDDFHKIFLHQAVLSALIMNELDRHRIRILPTVYSYPLHLNDEVPVSRRPKTLNELTHVVYEEVFPHLDYLKGTEVLEPLRSWLIAKVPDDVNTL